VKKRVLALAVILLTLPATAEEGPGTLVWKERCGKVYSGTLMVHSGDCHCTIRRIDRQLFHAHECPGKVYNHFTMRLPLLGPVVNQSGVREAVRMYQKKDGTIVLY